MRTSRYLLPIILVVLQIGCQPALPDPQDEIVAATTRYATSKPSPSVPTPQAIEQQMTPGKMPNPDESEIADHFIVSPVPEPLKFSFPTPGPIPVSAWRPPLYPTPWALTPFDHFFFARPIAADEINWPLADYRYGGVFLPDVVHTGIDIPAPLGTPVLAAGSGKVTWTGYGLYRGVKDETDPYGLAIAIKHEFGWQGQTLFTVYGHLDRIDVLVGQHVKAGEALGVVGQTGKVTGPHLHFEVRVGRNNYFVSRNPELWLAPPQGWGILAARIMNSSGELLPSHLIRIRSYDTQQSWTVKSYGHGTVVSDQYYRENMVLGDLPAGQYEVWIPYEGSTYNQDIEILPGLVSYFTFRGRRGFKTGPPPTPKAAFTPPAETLLSTP